jgi:integrase
MGRSEARESAPVQPVAEESIRAILPQLSPQVAAMIQLQHLCGARPKEVVSIRPSEVDTSGGVWLYRPRLVRQPNARRIEAGAGEKARSNGMPTG